MAGKENRRENGEGSREIVLSRVFDAPREVVFDLWTRPEHVREWFGPDGFTLTTDEMDARPGGVWRFTMHGPDGTDYPNRIVYVEVSRPTRLVYDQDDQQGRLRFHVTVDFIERASKTQVVLRMEFASSADREYVVEQMGAIEGGNQTLARLAEKAEEAARGRERSSIRDLVFTRVLNAPREVVFDVWTDPGHLARWWGPRGYTTPVCELDTRKGGLIRLDMRAPDGVTFSHRGVFQEVARPGRLVFTLFLLNGEGETIAEVLHTLTLTEHSGKTALTLGACVLQVAPEALPCLDQMNEGWTQTLDRLAVFAATPAGVETSPREKLS